MSLIVQKYGGSSVASPEKILKIAEFISNKKKQGHDLIIVVSAMGNSTDELFSLAKSVSKNPYSREMDMLLSAGERITMALLSMALQDLGVMAISFTGSQAGLLTEDKHQNARIIKITGERIKKALEEGKVVIIAGFQGVSLQKEITTLGRGGSDTTAVALAAEFHAQGCEIYTDVAGVYTADPSRISNTILNESICYSPMIEYALCGAAVLHPRSVALAKKYSVPLYVCKSLENRGSKIVKDSFLEKEKIIGVSSDSEKGFVTLKMQRSTLALAIIESAQKAQLELYEPHIAGNNFSFFINRAREQEWKKVCDSLCMDSFLESYEFLMNSKPVSIIADFIGTDGKILSQALSALSDQGIFIENFWVSGLKITFCISESHADDAVKCLHQEFFKR